ncbi:N-(5'-phosphoribosyl)anthranilate isomerase [Hyphomicrobium nitrativorans NL23]|uniref:N-(5'-phosphoribosyl)anthranilate isomerase n=1 Tax=Hyphomicrobium nitrativorans NL23 TaxID=1029756 RepID=V5SGS9_9HYPH|nr:phosphoribosylanthranilate isomerase [Hyphomicrobium nitrativorans]AHB49738.1 N-(5'-phosphoribosyl)anthranilate isomerase [Hyphomicrobium nitrativorans NL23]
MSTRVKICGIRTSDALDAALDAGADLIGLVLYPKSPRNVSLDEAAALTLRARHHGGADVVTLLVDPDDALVEAVAEKIKPDLIQLHGHEMTARVEAVRELSGLRILKAVPVGDAEDVAAAFDYLKPNGTRAQMLLFDAKPPADPGSLPGGNGLTFDWRILEAAKGRAPFALAGGLTPENVAAAIALTGAAIVDVSSGVESRPGEKDPERIRRFLKAAKVAKEA